MDYRRGFGGEETADGRSGDARISRARCDEARATSARRMNESNPEREREQWFLAVSLSHGQGGAAPPLLCVPWFSVCIRLHQGNKYHEVYDDN